MASGKHLCSTAVAACFVITLVAAIIWKVVTTPLDEAQISGASTQQGEEVRTALEFNDSSEILRANTSLDENSLDENVSSKEYYISYRYVFIVGLEGSGHHSLSTILKSLLKENNIVSKYFQMKKKLSPKVRTCPPSSYRNGQLLKQRTNDSLHYFLKTQILFDLEKKRQMHQNINLNDSENDTSLYNDTNRINIIPGLQQISYPFCSLSARSHPNIIELFLLIKTVEKEINNLNENFFNITFDLSIIVLNRIFINSIYSACDRFSNCEKRVSFYGKISLPILMRQMYFYIKYIHNNNMENKQNKVKYVDDIDNYNSNNFSLKYINYDKKDMKDYRNINDIVEQELLSKINDINNNDNSNIGIMFYDKIMQTCFDSKNCSNNSGGECKRQIETFSKNLLNLLKIPLKDVLINQTVNTIDQLFREMMEAKKNNSLYRVHHGNFQQNTTKDQVTVKNKLQTLTQFASRDDFIKWYYSQDIKDKHFTVENFQNFQSKIWNLFYIPQIALN